ncbi:MAG: hypothetical protein GX592_02015 [Clostridiales bacterium]|nr:hypothetical protein [Clostridiales bacterium]
MRKFYLAPAALLIALAILLSGCNLITVDPIMQLKEDRAKLEKEYGTVLAEYDGGTVAVGDILLEFYNELSYYYQMSASYGMGFGAEQIEQLKQSAVGYALERAAQRKEAEARGIALTEAEIAEIETEAREAYDGSLASYAPQMDGKTEEVRTAQAAFALFSEGYTYEGLASYLKAEKIAEKLHASVEAEVGEVTDEALKAVYEQRVEDDETYYASYLSDFESDMTGDTLITWMPEGYRTVKHILVIPEAAALDPYKQKLSQISAFEAELSSLNDDLVAATDDDGAEGDPDQIRAEIAQVEASIADAKAELPALANACLENVRAKLDDIQEKLDGGEDFLTLIDEYGEDPGMKNEPTRTRGYCVSAASTTWDPAFKNAAMLLESVGDVSEPVVGSSGVHIIRYESDVTPGAVPLDQVREALKEETLEKQREEHYAAKLAEWVEALNPVYHYDRWSPNA